MPLLSVYNRLIQGFVLSKQTRFDTHRESELKAVSANIMRMSSYQPLCKINFDDDTQKFILGIKEQALSLSASLKELHSDDESSVFNRKILASSDPSSVSLCLPENGEDAILPAPIEISIESMASPQKNKSFDVPSDGTSVLPGKYNFTVSLEQKCYSFQFNVAANSTNISILSKLSDFINKSNIGISANTCTNRLYNTVAIELMAGKVGRSANGEDAFFLKDTHFPDHVEKGIVDTFGLSNIAVPAVDTVFTINDEVHSSAVNEYYLTNSIYVTLNKTTDSPVKIGEVTDKYPIVDYISSFIDKYNQSISFIKDKGGNSRGGRRLYNVMTNICDDHRSAFRKCGISINSEGFMTYDEGTLYSAAEDDSLKEFFCDPNGFVKHMTNELSRIALDPFAFLDKTVVAYTNMSPNAFSKPYTSSAYSGLLFNNYC